MLPVPIRLKGLCTALSVKHAQDDLVVIDDFNSLTVDDPQVMGSFSSFNLFNLSFLLTSPNRETGAIQFCLLTSKLFFDKLLILFILVQPKSHRIF
jgi:hypothetical protein